jgi:D-arabinose 1-dehydrogenase-like Zn-dependent alcohol dehydrogenase
MRSNWAPSGCRCRATPPSWRRLRTSFDFIIDTVPVKHDLDPYLPLLDVGGTLCLVCQNRYGTRRHCLSCYFLSLAVL